MESINILPRLLKIGVFLGILGIGTFLYIQTSSNAKVNYITVAVQRGDVESTVIARGVLQPIKYVDVGAQTSGQLKSLKVQCGDQVTLGQLLAEIDPILATTALVAAEAALEGLIAQREGKLAQLVLAQTQGDRNEDLVKKNLIAIQDKDITHSINAVAVADVKVISAQIKQAEAAVDTAKAALGYTKITAPIAGEVVSINLLEGQTLNDKQQAPTILRIADLATMTVCAQVSEADIGLVKPGQDVYFTVLGQSDVRWDGKIRQILPTPELINNVVFYDVLFDIPNTEQKLKIQMTAQVFIVLAKTKNALVIPTSVVGNADEGAEITVRLLQPDGSSASRTIKIGIKSELMAEVTNGLKEKEQIILREAKTKTNTQSVFSATKGH
ncbi:MAG: efflux RND transporter periplasmic adaptor subunit [Candidatus Riflebacteria bacterium]|nr:efflux RND transporter periplasmic adaptor subunit [Candidatus Riflebacteria bacterium]